MCAVLRCVMLQGRLVQMALDTLACLQEEGPTQEEVDTLRWVPALAVAAHVHHNAACLQRSSFPCEADEGVSTHNVICTPCTLYNAPKSVHQLVLTQLITAQQPLHCKLWRTLTDNAPCLCYNSTPCAALLWCCTALCRAML
jgi:hypothetical protein